MRFPILGVGCSAATDCDWIGLGGDRAVTSKRGRVTQSVCCVNYTQENIRKDPSVDTSVHVEED